MKETKTVSVIIPVYNSARYLADTIESILAQTYSNIEIIAVDDGSTDNSVEILKSYEPRLNVIRQPNRGPGAARNHGVRSSTGELLAFIDSDDLWDVEKIERQVEVLNNYPEAAAVYCETRRIDSSGITYQKTDAYRVSRPSGLIFELLLRGRGIICWSPTQAMVTRQSYIEAGGFPEDIRQAEDYEFWLRLSLQGPILYLVDTLTSYRRHAASLSLSDGHQYERLSAFYQILTRLERDSFSEPRISQLGLVRSELYEHAKALAYVARTHRDYELAIDAYKTSVRLQPFAMGLWMRLGLTLLLRLRQTNSDGQDANT